MRDSGTPVQTISYNYAVDGTLSTSAWVQLDSSLNARCSHADIFDGSGVAIKLGYGPSGSEVDLVVVPPGGFTGRFPLKLDEGMRLSVKGVSGNATSGYLIINLYG